MRVLSAATTGAIVGALFAIPLMGMVVETQAPPAVSRPDPVIELFTEYECWTDDGEEHPVPAGALVTLPGGEPAIQPADVGFGIWLEGDPGQLHAFCKEGPR